MTFRLDTKNQIAQFLYKKKMIQFSDRVITHYKNKELKMKKQRIAAFVLGLCMVLALLSGTGSHAQTTVGTETYGELEIKYYELKEILEQSKQYPQDLPYFDIMDYMNDIKRHLKESNGKIRGAVGNDNIYTVFENENYLFKDKDGKVLLTLPEESVTTSDRYPGQMFKRKIEYVGTFNDGLCGVILSLEGIRDDKPKGGAYIVTNTVIAPYMTYIDIQGREIGWEGTVFSMGIKSRRPHDFKDGTVTTTVGIHDPKGGLIVGDDAYVTLYSSKYKNAGDFFAVTKGFTRSDDGTKIPFFSIYRESDKKEIYRENVTKKNYLFTGFDGSYFKFSEYDPDTYDSITDYYVDKNGKVEIVNSPKPDAEGYYSYNAKSPNGAFSLFYKQNRYYGYKDLKIMDKDGKVLHDLQNPNFVIKDIVSAWITEDNKVVLN